MTINGRLFIAPYVLQQLALPYGSCTLLPSNSLVIKNSLMYKLNNTPLLYQNVFEIYYYDLTYLFGTKRSSRHHFEVNAG